MKVNKTLKTLYLSQRAINIIDNISVGLAGSKKLFELIKINKTLSSLYFSFILIYHYLEGNNIGDEGLYAILEAMKNNSSLIYLDLCI